MKGEEVPTEVLNLAEWLQLCRDLHSCQTFLRSTEAKASSREDRREGLDGREGFILREVPPRAASGSLVHAGCGNLNGRL